MNYYYHPNMPGGNGEPPRPGENGEGVEKTLAMKDTVPGAVPPQGTQPQSVQGQPMYRQPVQGQPVQQPVQQPVYRQPVQGQPVYQQPVQQPVYRQPVQQPVYQQPIQQPVQPQPTYPQPVQGQPMYRQPVQPQPMQGQPVQGQPMYHQPVQPQPMYGQPVYGQPMYAQPVPPMPMQPVISPEEQAKLDAQQAEYKAIRRHGNGLGVGMLLVQAIGTVVAFLVPFLAELFLPGVTENGGVFYDAIEYAIYSPVAILLSMWIGLKIIRKPFGELVPFGRIKPVVWLGCILFSFAFIFVGNIAGDVAAMLSPTTVENLETAMGNEPTTTVELIVNILQVAAIPALVEELAFRGIALGVLRPYGDKFAIIVSSLLFGLLHGNIVQIPFAFCLGLIMGYTVVRTNNILPAMIIHFINNGMSCLLSYFITQYNLPQEQQGMVMMALYGVWAVIGVGGFFLLRFGGKEKLRACYTPYQGCLTTGKRNKALLASAPLIASMVIYGMTVLMMLMNISDILSQMPF